MKPSYVKHKDREARVNSAITAIKAILPLDLYPAHKKELLSVCIWKITEADGKSKVRYWSQCAVDNKTAKLQHEHIHERRELITRLLSGEAIGSVIPDAVACMVTKEEHAKLNASSNQGWQRYKDAGIRVYDAQEQEWCW